MLMFWWCWCFYDDDDVLIERLEYDDDDVSLIERLEVADDDDVLWLKD